MSASFASSDIFIPNSMKLRSFVIRWGRQILALREVHILRVMRRIYSLKRNEIIGGWRKLHNEEFYIFYSSSDVIIITKLRRMR
jgi:hypothetical protein